MNGHVPDTFSAEQEKTLRANYVRFVAGMLCGELAYHVQAVAVAWHIFVLHHRALDLGLVGLVLFLPALLLVIPAGEVCDRYPRRNILILSQSFEVCCTLLLLVAVCSGVRELSIYLAILAGTGTARAFGAPAERSLLPVILKRESYLRFQARFLAFRQLIVVGGPALGGILVALSTATALGGALIMLVLSAVLLGSIVLEQTEPIERTFSWKSAFDGLHFIIAHPVVAGAITLDLFAVLFGGATELLPAFADGIFHVGPVGLGVLRSAPAVGAALVATVLQRRPLARRVGKRLFWAVGIFGVGTIGFGMSRNFLLSCFCLVVVGGADMVSVVIRNGLVQLTTPNAMRGRVSAFENIFIGASNELGGFESGVMAALLGVVPSVIVGGFGTLLILSLWGFAMPSLWRADHMVQETSSS